MSSTWGSWLGLSSGSSEEAKEAKAEAKAAMQAKAVQELRAMLLGSEEGRLAAEKMAQGEIAGRCYAIR